MGEIKRTLKEIPDTVLKTNNPNDFLDFSLSYYLPETKGKINEAVDAFRVQIGKILDEDRKIAGITGKHAAARNSYMFSKVNK